MERRKRLHKHQGKIQAGVALLIAIFVLLLVSVVAISLIISSGTETALGGNYRSSTNVYYAAMAGLEEARGRLLPKNSAPIVPPPLGQVTYIKNPLAGEDVLAAYPDTEYGAEFAGSPFATPAITPVSSISGVNAQGLVGPSFKWVRINAVTEKSLNIDVDNNGSLDSTTPLFYDGAHLNLTSTGSPALEITVLAVETTASPNPSQRLLQYVVAPKFLSLNPLQNSTGGAAPNGVPAAVTLVGSLTNCPGGCPFSATSSSFHVNGNDSGASCAALPSSIYALGVTDPNNLTAIVSNLTGSGSGGGGGGDGGGGDGGGGGGGGGSSGGGGSGIPPRGSNYTGSTPSPSVGNVSGVLPPGLQNAGTITQLAQTIQQNADKMITGSATEADMPYGMSASNPMTVVVNGDLTLSGSFTGNGLLLVTGNFTFSSDSSWHGLILVVGRGTVTETSGSTVPGSGEIDGSIVVASVSPNPLAPATMPPTTPTLGSINYNVSGANGAGVHYNSCNISSALPMTKFQTLSFREIPQ